VARHLVSSGRRPEVWVLADPARFQGDALANWRILQNLDLTIRLLTDLRSRSAFLKRVAYPDIIVDALFGTGLSKPIGPEYRGIVTWVNQARPRAFVMAVDIPSGLFADSHLLSGPVVQADVTVTFTAPKAGLLFPPAADKAGRVVVAAIGSPAPLLDNPEYRLELIDRDLVRRALPPRARDSHKGTFGHVFVLAGSRDKSGAAIMTGLSALRSGAGLVTLMLPESLRRNVTGKVPELMTAWLPETREGTADFSAKEMILDLLAQADAVVIGPGMSTNGATRKLIREVVRWSPVAVLLDADGINAFAGQHRDLCNDGGQPIVITPHPGEMGRLLGLKTAEIQRRRLEVAVESAERLKVFSVLKGFQTLIATPVGRILVNTTGNPGMATGGTGDVLAGIMGRFLGGWQCRFGGGSTDSLAEYLATAVYLHGLAGDLAAAEKGEESLIATDLIEHLPHAFKGVCS
jgi:ADP-dependent NAD(P)H-hydrate dehydratase / NAD(P)H-hydrate epimerase